MSTHSSSSTTSLVMEGFEENSDNFAEGLKVQTFKDRIQDLQSRDDALNNGREKSVYNGSTPKVNITSREFYTDFKVPTSKVNVPSRKNVGGRSSFPPYETHNIDGPSSFREESVSNGSTPKVDITSREFLTDFKDSPSRFDQSVTSDIDGPTSLREESISNGSTPKVNVPSRENVGGFKDKKKSMFEQSVTNGIDGPTSLREESVSNGSTPKINVPFRENVGGFKDEKKSMIEQSVTNHNGVGPTPGVPTTPRIKVGGMFCFKHDDKAAKFTCRDCEALMCEKCKEYHTTRPIFVNHQVVAIGKVVCTKHYQTYAYFCDKCAVFLCKRCLWDGECKDHDANIKTYQETTAKEDLETLISDLKKQIENVDKDVIPSLKTVEKKLTEVEQVKKKLKNHAKELKVRLQTRIEILNIEVEDCHQALLSLKASLKKQDIDKLKKLLTSAEGAKKQSMEEILVTMHGVKATIDQINHKDQVNQINVNSTIVFKAQDSVNVAEFKFSEGYEHLTKEQILALFKPGTRVKKGQNLTEKETCWNRTTATAFPINCDQGKIRAVVSRNPVAFTVTWDSGECASAAACHYYRMGSHPKHGSIYRLDLV